jgi:hypothetical protein
MGLQGYVPEQVYLSHGKIVCHLSYGMALGLPTL